MAADMVVAGGRSTVDGGTLFAHNSNGRPGERPTWCLLAGRSFAPGEFIQAQCLRLPQVRQTFTVLGCQPAGSWGYEHGVNEHGVAIGRTTHHSKLRCHGPGLTGADLVRLALERSRTAQQAIDLLTDFIERHGQGKFPDGPPQAECDNSLLVAGPSEAFLLEAAGNHWVFQEIQHVRAVSDVSLVRQDWNRISRGLASQAIENGWWPGDGSKLDFAGSISAEPTGRDSALRRWGRAMLMLEQQAGHIDVAFVRRLLADHYETTPTEVDPFGPGAGPAALCQHGNAAGGYTAASVVAPLGRNAAKLTPAWCAFGPPCITVYFPLFLEGELPPGFNGGGDAAGRSVWAQTHRLNELVRQQAERLPLYSEALGRLQGRFDQEAEEFAAEQAVAKQADKPEELHRRASNFMQHTLEQFQGVIEGLLRPDRQRSPAVTGP